MPRLLTCSLIFLLWILVSASFLQAQILVDSFFNDTADLVAPGSPSSEITNNIFGSGFDREIYVEASPSYSIVSTVTSDVLVVDGGGTGSGSASATLEYLGLPGGGLDLGSNTFFQLNVAKVVGTPLLGLQLTSNLSGSGTMTGAVQLAPTNDPLSFHIDLTQLSGYSAAFVSQLNSITLFIADDNEDFFVEGDSIQFTSVPEPQTYLLITIALLVLLLLAHRTPSRAHSIPAK